jgi:hypothetical protein
VPFVIGLPFSYMWPVRSDTSDTSLNTCKVHAWYIFESVYLL